MIRCDSRREAFNRLPLATAGIATAKRRIFWFLAVVLVGLLFSFCAVIERVQKEGKVIPDLNKIYPGVSFKDKSEWETGNKELNEGLGGLVETLKQQTASIKQQRIANGIEAKFSKMTSKELPKESSQ